MVTSYIFEPLAPREAIEAIAIKSTQAGWAYDWRDVAPDEHAAAFYIAKMKDQALLADMKAAVEQAIANGETFKQFEAGITDKLIDAGWWGKQEMVDPVTGQTELVQLGSPRRLRVIYQTNMRQAYQAGLWQRIQASKVGLPYLRYQTAPDDRVRAQHLEWNDIVLPVDHPFWLTHFPMNGWGCRCVVVQMSAGMVRRAGLTVTSEAEVARKMGTPMQVRNKRTGIVETVWPGIDPGFAYNPGVARLEHLKRLAEADPTMLQGRKVAAPKQLKGPTVDPGFAKSKDWAAATTELARDGVAQSWVVDRQAATGNEHAVAFDEVGRLLQANAGLARSVAPLWKRRLLSGSRIRVHHSHPDPGGLSFGDFSSNWVNGKAVTVVAHDSAGGRYAARALVQPSKWQALYVLGVKEAETRLGYMRASPSLIEHSVCEALARLRFIRYEAMVSEADQAEIGRLGDMWTQLIDALAAMMEGG
jgi:hypothetical protein